MQQLSDYTLQFSRRTPYIGQLPAVPVTLNDEFYVVGYIDSGCQESLLIESYATEIGIKEIEVDDPSRKVTLYGMRDPTTDPPIGYRHWIDIDIMGAEIPECPVVIVRDHPFHALFNIPLVLGRVPVFAKLQRIGIEEGEGEMDNFLYFA